MRMYSKMPGSWCAVSSKRVHEQCHRYPSRCSSPKNVEPVLQCRVRLIKGSCHICQTVASTVPSPTAKLVMRHHIRMSSTLHSTLISCQSGYLTDMEANVHTTSTGESVTMQHIVQLGSLHLVDIRILDI